MKKKRSKSIRKNKKPQTIKCIYNPNHKVDEDSQINLTINNNLLTILSHNQ